MLQFRDFQNAVGPNAAIVFAAWIFMGFPQQRYDSAVGRFRDAVGDFRSQKHEESRGGNLKDQILIYRRRCRLMGLATRVGLVSAMLLISSLIFGGLDLVLPHTPWVVGLGITTTFAGFGLVIAAAMIVLIEGWSLDKQLDDELRDVPSLREP